MKQMYSPSGCKQRGKLCHLEKQEGLLAVKRVLEEHSRTQTTFLNAFPSRPIIFRNLKNDFQPMLNAKYQYQVCRKVKLHAKVSFTVDDQRMLATVLHVCMDRKFLIAKKKHYYDRT